MLLEATRAHPPLAKWALGPDAVEPPSRPKVYVHFCRVEVGEDFPHARDVLTAMCNRFPAPTYAVEMTQWVTTGTPVDY